LINSVEFSACLGTNSRDLNNQGLCDNRRNTSETPAQDENFYSYFIHLNWNCRLPNAKQAPRQGIGDTVVGFNFLRIL
jgi:hypothetical protein